MTSGRGRVETGDAEHEFMRVKAWAVLAVIGAVLLLGAAILLVRPVHASDGSSCGPAFTAGLPVDPGPSGEDAAFRECKRRVNSAALPVCPFGVAGVALVLSAFGLRQRGGPRLPVIPPQP